MHPAPHTYTARVCLCDGDDTGEGFSLYSGDSWEHRYDVLWVRSLKLRSEGVRLTVYFSNLTLSPCVINNYNYDGL